MDSKTTTTTAPLPSRSGSPFAAQAGVAAFWQQTAAHRDGGVLGFAVRLRSAYDVPNTARTTVSDPMFLSADRIDAKKAAPPRGAPH